MATALSRRLRDVNPLVTRQYLLSILFLVIGTFLGAITSEKTTFLYKEALHLKASDVATLNLILAIPVYLQPFLGAWTELMPWGGYRRRPYFALGVIVAALGYLGMALLPMYTYKTIVPLLLVVATGGVLRNVIIGAVFTAVGNQTGILARLQTIMGFIGLVLGATYTSHLGGYVAQYWSYKAVFLWGAGLTLLKLPLLFLIADPRVARTHGMDESQKAQHKEAQRAARQETIRALQKAGQDWRFWVVVSWIAFLALTPFPGSAQIYYETDALHFSKLFIGDLNAWSSVGSLLGGISVYFLSRRIQVRVLPYVYVGMNVALYGCYLLMHDAVSARICFLLSGFLSSFVGIAATVLTARACPRGIEGTVLAFLGAVGTLFALLCDKWGTWLYDYYGPSNTQQHYTVAHGWTVSLWYGLIMCVIAFVFIPFLPSWAHSKRTISEPTEEY